MRKSFSFLYSVFASILAIFIFYLLGFIFSSAHLNLGHYYFTVAFIYFMLLSYILGMLSAFWLKPAGIRRFLPPFLFVVMSVGLVLSKELIKLLLLPNIAVVILLISSFYFGWLFIFRGLGHIKKRYKAFQAQRAEKKEKTAEAKKKHPSAYKRRSFQRYLDRVRVACQYQDLRWECQSKDISASGLRLISKEKLSKGEVLSLTIYLSQDSRPVYAQGVVAWVDYFASEQEGVYYAGVKFTKIEAADKIRLVSKYIFESFRQF